MRVAILQAGGRGQRIAGFTQGAVPKQLLPLHHGAVIDYGLEACRIAGCLPHIVVPDGDSRIVEYANSRSLRQPVFCYSRGSQVHDTSLLSNLYIDADVAYIMPDTVFKPPNAVEILFQILDVTDHAFALALFNTDTPDKFGMCFPRDDHRVTQVVDKPLVWGEDSSLAWGLIAWHDIGWHVVQDSARAGDRHFSAVLNRAIEHLGPIPSFLLDDYMDIATEQDYRQALEDGW